MEQEPLSINAALAEIQIARAHLSATGAADVETGQLDALEQRLMSGQISAQEVMDKVLQMLAGRLDYH